MDDRPWTARKRWTLGALMGGIAALAVLFAAFKPYAPAVSAATRVLSQFGPRSGRYLAVATTKMPSGYWKVQFVRVAGSGATTQTVMVPDDVVKDSRDVP